MLLLPLFRNVHCFRVQLLGFITMVSSNGPVYLHTVKERCAVEYNAMNKKCHVKLTKL